MPLARPWTRGYPPDLFCPVNQALKIYPRKENISGLGRPIKLMDGGRR
jgi:hypothetical protein